MSDMLSLWRAPLDQVAIIEAEALSNRQPRCSCTIDFTTDFSAITVYNYGTYGADPGGLPSANTEALETMFALMKDTTPIGGMALIEQDNFPANAPAGTDTSGGIKVPDQCNVSGTGGGGTPSGTASAFFHFAISPLGAGRSIFFNCFDASGAGHTSGGIYFRSLAFQWGETSEPDDTCIHAGIWNVRAVNCTFTDCPRAFGAQGVSCTLEQCTINYTVGSPGSAKAVVLGGPQCAVVGPGQFSQTSPSTESGGASNCTCISIEEAEHPIVANIQINEWTIGIDFSQQDGTRFAQITNCEIECWGTALKIRLSSGHNATTAGIKVTSCTLAKASDSNDPSPIVLIDARGSTYNSSLNDIALTDCAVYNGYASPPGDQYGLEITSGSDIRIIGGTYSNNSPTRGAGIAITGSASDVQIVGANLQPTYPGAANPNPQQYGLLVTAAVTNVIVDGCDLSGYTNTGQSAVQVTAAQSTNALLIKNCPGYNDHNIALTATNTMITGGVSAVTCSNPYFGPSVLVYAGSSPVVLHVFGQTITAAFGIIFLPSPYDTFSFNIKPTTFSWTGK